MALKNCSSSPGRAVLFRATMKAFGPAFLLPIIPRLLLMIATLIQPFLVNRMVPFVSSSESPSVGWALVGGYVCVYGVMPIVTALYWQKVCLALLLLQILILCLRRCTPLQFSIEQLSWAQFIRKHCGLPSMKVRQLELVPPVLICEISNHCVFTQIHSVGLSMLKGFVRV